MAPKCCTACDAGYTRVILGIQGRIDKALGNLGALSARHAWWFTLLSVLAAAAAAAGWSTFRIESSGDKLWVPQHSKAKKDESWVDSFYATGGGGAQFLGSVHPSRTAQYGVNALQLGVFHELFRVDAAVRAITVSQGGTTYGWQDVCNTNARGLCKYGGPLNLWNMDFDTYLAAVGGNRSDPTAGNRAALVEAVNKRFFPDNSPVSTLSIFGGIVLSPLASPPPGAPPLFMSSARLLSCGYGLRDGLGDVEDKWYNKFLDVVEALQPTLQHASLAYIAGNSVDTEIGASVTKDLYLIVVSIAIFVLVAVAGMSRLHSVATRSSLALLGVVSSLLAMVAGYGLSLAFGCPFTTLAQTLPYILLGMSIDCMFVLSKAYDSVAAAHPGASLEQRMRLLWGSVGTSVVITLLASAVAFALGSISEIPAIHWFSVYATMGVVCITVATLTFFAGVLALTERRIARNRIDCCCCATSGNPLVPTAARTLVEPRAGDGGAAAAGPAADGEGYVPAALVIPVAPVPAPAPARVAVAEAAEKQQYGSVELYGGSSATNQAVLDPKHAAGPGPYVLPPAPLSRAEAEPNLMRSLFARYYAPFLTKWYGKVIVLALFIGWAVLTGVGIPRLKEGQPLSELAPDDSYLQDYVRAMKDTFETQLGSPTDLYFRGFDPSPPAQQARMLSALAATLEARYVNSTVSAFQGNWLIEFIGWVQSERPDVTLVAAPGCTNPFLNRTSGDLGLFVDPAPFAGCVPQQQFYPLLFEFLPLHRSYLDDLRIAPAPGADPANASAYEVWSSRFTVVHSAPGDINGYGRLSLKAVRSLERDVNRGVFAGADGDDPFLMFNSDYIFNEGDAILGSMTIEYILLAVAGVGAVLALTLPSPRAVLLMMLAVGMTDYCLFGQMFILGIRFNQVSIINMIMATGLAVDYSVYFAQKFVAVAADGTRNGRMVEALTETGSAVFVGGLTALAGTIPLAFSSSTILRTFFSLIFGTISFALLIGLMLMPVIFSLVGPPPLQRSKERSADSSVAAQEAALPAKGTDSV